MAKLFRRDEIFNRHNQPIYLFASQVGNTDLEKYLNLLNGWGLVEDVDYKIFSNVATNIGNITLIADEQNNEEGYVTCIQIFNDLGEKINEIQIDGLDFNMLNDVSELRYDLSDNDIDLI